MLNLITDHSAPLFVLLIDFTTVSTIPFCKRHLIGTLGIFIAYIITNFTYQMITGKAVYYPVLDWENPVGVLLFFILAIVGVLVFYLFIYVTKKKFVKLGHHHMVKI